MKNRTSVAILAIVVVGISASPALGFINFGARIGVDHTTWDAHEVAGFTLGTGTATLVREAIDRPLLLGVTLGTGLLPVLDLEIAAEAAFRKYHFDYSTNEGQAASDDIYYSRISVLATLKKNLLSFPPVTSVVKIYAGGGLGLHYVSPVMNKNLIMDSLSDATDTLDPKELIDKDLEVGFHGLGGIRLKPPALPLALYGEVRYLIKSDEEFGKPGSHWSFYGGVTVGF
ncbi:MAG: hypothetical protein KAW17_07745 [Candidatus Eisenbacteria sp.]|nr:hypothetical protein [Candidatus Eisenbacteria bacterium]